MVVVGVVLVLYSVITESLDWIGRMDVIERRWPKLETLKGSHRLRIVIFLIGLGLLVKVVMESRPASPPPRSTGTEPPKSEIAQPSFGTSLVLPDGRTIISCSPEDLQDAHHKNTIDQFNRLLGGKWIKISVKVAENYGEGKIFSLTKNSPFFALQFAKGWSEQLSALPRGSSITIRGKVAPAETGWINVVECELL